MSNPIPEHVVGLRPTVSPFAAGAAITALVALAGCGGEGEESPSTSAAAPVVPVIQHQAAPSSPPSAAGEEGDATSTADTRPGINLVDLVPNSATAYVEFESLNALEEAVLRIRSEGDLDGLVEWEPMDMLTPFLAAGVDVQKMSAAHPFALALAPIPGTDEQSTVLILPAVDQKPLVRSIAAMASEQFTATRFDGDYVVIQHEELEATPESRGSAEVTQKLPDGFMRGRMTVSDLIETLGPYITSATDEVNEQYRIARPYLAGNEVTKFDTETLFEALRGAREVAFGLELEADRVTAHARLVDLEEVAEDAPLGPQIERRVLEALSRHIYGSDPFARIVAFEPEEVLDRLKGAWEVISGSTLIYGRGSRGRTYPGMDMGASAQAAIQAAVLKMLRSFEDAAAVSFGLEPGEAYAAVYLVSSDPARTREAISLMLAKCDLDSWGFEMALPVRSIVEETLVEDYSVRFDTRRIDFDERAAMREAFKTYLGDSKLHLKVATSGDHVLLLLGGDTPGTMQRVREFSEESPVDARIAEAAELVEEYEYAQVHHSDVIRLIADVTSLRSLHVGDAPPVSIREIRRQAEDDPAQVTIWNAVDGGDAVMGASFELSGLRSAVEAVKLSGL
jgi:hypothetical protein